MKLVNKNPLFPKLSIRTIPGIFSSLSRLIQDLSTILTEFAFRINNLYPKDGSEKMDFLAITSSVSAPDTDSTRAVIYVDSSSGNLNVKFKNGDVQLLATVSV